MNVRFLAHVPSGDVSSQKPVSTGASPFEMLLPFSAEFLRAVWACVLTPWLAFIQSSSEDCVPLHSIVKLAI